MAQILMQFDAPVVHTDGTSYAARVCGREREDGLWEGWIEFVDAATGTVLRTVRETTQPNLRDLTYWATGLSPVYLEGALARILTAPRPVKTTPAPPPHFDGPAPRQEKPPAPPDSILNPFSVYAKNPDLLAQELTALRGWHLRQIIRDYDLVDEDTIRLENMSEPELGTLIMQRVRDLRA